MSFRATNLNTQTTYLNSAITTAEIGASNALTTINVTDTSNNGDSTFTDPNNNGNAVELGENVPTPFSFGVLPVKFLTVTGNLRPDGSTLLNWKVATPMENAERFEVEFSTDGRSWQTIGSLEIVKTRQADWQLLHSLVPSGQLYYRIRQIDFDGSFTYSKIVLLNNRSQKVNVTVYPNPADNMLLLSTTGIVRQPAHIEWYDASGRLLQRRSWNGSTFSFPTESYPNGTYLLKCLQAEAAEIHRVIIRRK